MGKESEAGEKKAKTKRPTPLKRDGQSEKRYMRNKAFKSQVRSALRSFDETLPSKDKAAIQDKLNLVYSLMDKGVKRGVFKLNKAKRQKSRAVAKITALSS